MRKPQIQAKIPIKDFEAIEKLVKEGYYISRSDFFRKAIKILLNTHQNVD